MKYYLSRLIFLIGVSISFVCLVNSRSVFAQSSDENKVITRFIARQARINKAVEYEGARKIIRADLNQDGKEDAVVLYTLESFGGSNLHLQYLAVFVQSKNNELRYVTHTIPKHGAVDLDSVKNGKINITTFNYLPSDGRCCPSRKGRAQIVLSKNKLIEIRH